MRPSPRNSSLYRQARPALPAIDCYCTVVVNTSPIFSLVAQTVSCCWLSRLSMRKTLRRRLAPHN